MDILHFALLALLAAQTAPLPPTAAEAAEDAPPAVSPASRAYTERLLADLRQSPSPRERALGTMMYSSTYSPLTDGARETAEHGKRLRAAAQAAPADVLVQYLWALTYDEAAGCTPRSPCPDRRQAAARLEPGNGMAWMLGLDVTQNQRGRPEIDALLAKAAATEQFDDHFVDGLKAWTDILHSRPMPAEVTRESLRDVSGKLPAIVSDPEEATKVMAFGFAAALTLQGGSAYLVCRRHDQPAVAEARFELCAQIGRKMSRLGSSTMTQMMGHALVSGAGLATSDDEALYRSLRWRQDRFTALQDALGDPAEFRAYYSDLIDTGSEGRAQELLLQRHGVALEPPAEWQIPDYRPTR